MRYEGYDEGGNWLGIGLAEGTSTDGAPLERFLVDALLFWNQALTVFASLWSQSVYER